MGIRLDRSKYFVLLSLLMIVWTTIFQPFSVVYANSGVLDNQQNTEKELCEIPLKIILENNSTEEFVDITIDSNDGQDVVEIQNHLLSEDIPYDFKPLKEYEITVTLEGFEISSKYIQFNEDDCNLPQKITFQLNEEKELKKEQVSQIDKVENTEWGTILGMLTYLKLFNEPYIEDAIQKSNGTKQEIIDIHDFVKNDFKSITITDEETGKVVLKSNQYTFPLSQYILDNLDNEYLVNIESKSYYVEEFKYEFKTYFYLSLDDINNDDVRPMKDKFNLDELLNILELPKNTNMYYILDSSNSMEYKIQSKYLIYPLEINIGLANTKVKLKSNISGQVDGVEPIEQEFMTDNKGNLHLPFGTIPRVYRSGDVMGIYKHELFIESDLINESYFDLDYIYDGSDLIIGNETYDSDKLDDWNKLEERIVPRKIPFKFNLPITFKTIDGIIVNSNMENEKLLITYTDKLTNKKETLTETIVNGQAKIELSGVLYDTELEITLGKEKVTKVVSESINDSNYFEITLDKDEVCENFTVYSSLEGAIVEVVNMDTKEVSLGEIVEGKFTLNKEIKKDHNLEITVSKENYNSKTIVVDLEKVCEVTMELEPKVCSSMEIQTNVNQGTVKIYDIKNNLIEEGKLNDSKYTMKKQLTYGEVISIEVESPYYVVSRSIYTVGDGCLIEINLTKDMCESYTINSNIEGSTVTLKTEDGTLIEKGEIKDGKYTVSQPLDKENKYSVTISKKFYNSKSVVVNLENSCSITVHIQRDTVTNFNVTTNVKNAKVTLKQNNKTFKFVNDGNNHVLKEKLEKGHEYELIVEKEHYITATKRFILDTVDTIHVSLEREQISNFTIESTIEMADVNISDSEGNLVDTGKIEDGKFTSVKPLNKGKTYKITVSKPDYITFEKDVQILEDSIKIELDKITFSNLEITSNIEGSNVQVTVPNTDKVFNGTIKEGKLIIDYVFEKGMELDVVIEKENYNKISKSITLQTNKLNFDLSPEMVNNFVITSNVEDSIVTILDGTTLIENGQMVDGKYVVANSLDKTKTYEIIVEKKFYETIIKDVQPNTDGAVEFKLTQKTFDSIKVTSNVEKAEVVVKDLVTGNKFEGSLNNGILNLNGEFLKGNLHEILVTSPNYVTQSKQVYLTVNSVNVNLVKDKIKDFKLKINSKESFITIQNYAGDLVESGNSLDGVYSVNTDLIKGDVYTFTVSSKGYDTYIENITVLDQNLEIILNKIKEVEIVVPTPPIEKEICSKFTVEFNKQVEDVQLLTKDGKQIDKITTTSNIFKTDKELELDKVYVISYKFNGIEYLYEFKLEDNCNLKIDVVDEVKPDLNKYYTIKVEPKDVHVTIVDEDMNIVLDNTIVEDVTTFKLDLNDNVGYKVVATKEGYNPYEIVVTNDVKDILITLVKMKDICETTTFNFNVDDVEVELKENNNTIYKGKVNGKSLQLKDILIKDKEYQLIVTKNGYKVQTKIFKHFDCEYTYELEIEDEQLTEPIKNACNSLSVILSGNRIKDFNVQLIDIDGEIIEKGKTNSDGHFVFKTKITENDNFTVKISKSGYKTIIRNQKNIKNCIVEESPERIKSVGSGNNSKYTSNESSTTQNLCEVFTINVNSKNAYVKLLDNEGNVLVEGLTDNDGNITYNHRLLKNKTYKIFATNEGFRSKKVEFTTDSSDLCNFTVILNKDETISKPINTETETEPNSEQSKNDLDIDDFNQLNESNTEHKQEEINKSEKPFIEVIENVSSKPTSNVKGTSNIYLVEDDFKNSESNNYPNFVTTKDVDKVKEDIGKNQPLPQTNTNNSFTMYLLLGMFLVLVGISIRRFPQTL